MVEALRKHETDLCPGFVTYLRLIVGLLLFAGGLASGAPAFGMGGDLVSPQFPFKDSRIRKQEARAAAVDSNGNIFMAGYQNLGGSIDDDYNIVKILADGSGIAWRATYNQAGGSDQAVAMVVDANNDVIVTGNVWNGTNIDIYTVKYKGSPGGATGQVIWSHTFNGGGFDTATSITLDPVNNVVYVGGYTQNASL
ncbi:MAG TPA: hypothetical protein VEM32_04730, partial [Geobacteraceae bacterium]|nr:hypothetical protein [Geobacteraceae bacterium]